MYEKWSGTNGPNSRMSWSALWSDCCTLLLVTESDIYNCADRRLQKLLKNVMKWLQNKVSRAAPTNIPIWQLVTHLSVKNPTPVTIYLPRIQLQRCVCLSGLPKNDDAICTSRILYRLLKNVMVKIMKCLHNRQWSDHTFATAHLPRFNCKDGDDYYADDLTMIILLASVANSIGNSLKNAMVKIKEWLKKPTCRWSNHTLVTVHLPRLNCRGAHDSPHYLRMIILFAPVGHFIGYSIKNVMG